MKLYAGAVTNDREQITGGAICAGASLLPDLDEPGSTVSHVLEPVSGAVSYALARVCDGHRKASHSLIGVALVVGQSVADMQPFYPRWRRRLLKNGIDRISPHDARAHNLMTSFVNEAMSPEHQDKEKMHHLRNIIYAQDIPIMRDRGWKR